jgi:hypothetical protein
MITCQGCGSAEQIAITPHASGERGRWNASCEQCQESWDFSD